jgi:transposase-like protein
MQEAVRVIVESDASVARWASTLGCSAAQLRHAVKQVGPEISDIQEYLELAKMPDDPPELQTALTAPTKPTRYPFRRKRAWD